MPLGPPVYMHTEHACAVFVAPFKVPTSKTLASTFCTTSRSKFREMGDDVRTNLSLTEKVKIGICIERRSATPATNIITWDELSPLLPPCSSSHMAVVAKTAVTQLRLRPTRSGKLYPRISKNSTIKETELIDDVYYW